MKRSSSGAGVSMEWMALRASKLAMGTLWRKTWDTVEVTSIAVTGV
jgi:hypothetical protein